MHFTWLSGDDVCQSLAHNLDRTGWVLREQVPIKCHGMGGRSATFGEVYGNVFDHHAVNYEYANGVKVYAYCRTQNGCYGNSQSIILGSKGQVHLGGPIVVGNQVKWKYEGPNGNPYDLEHKAFFAAIRSGTPSTAATTWPATRHATVMGQLACYSGQELTAEQIGKSSFFYAPKAEDVRLDMPPPVNPDEKG